ncbi:MAG: DUF2490 domain-containing protein [Cytophagales bacterium]|nr:MAG: DUF2490 domain-containing protein [Cytophagales bacterium]
MKRDNHNIKLISLFVIFFSFVSTVFAQNQGEGLGSWNIINVKLKINNRWSMFIEPQLRSLAFYQQFHYYEIKSGFSYNIDQNFSISTGIGTYNTYSEGGNFHAPLKQGEIRTWLQIAMNESFGKLKFEHRYRAEQRFANSTYRNRFRYRLNLAIPLNHKGIILNTFYAIVWNEIFFTDNEPYFERNRFFTGIGYKLNETLATQVGYLHQFDYKLNDETGRSFLQISLLLNFDLKDVKHGFHPAISD